LRPGFARTSGVPARVARSPGTIAISPPSVSTSPRDNTSSDAGHGVRRFEPALAAADHAAGEAAPIVAPVAEQLLERRGIREPVEPLDGRRRRAYRARDRWRRCAGAGRAQSRAIKVAAMCEGVAEAVVGVDASKVR
jgi:hypothetical protein